MGNRMQHPEVKICPVGRAHGYGDLSPELAYLEGVASQYPSLKTNKPMRIHPMSAKEFADLVNGGYA